MALNNSQLQALIDQNIPDNNTEFITPEKLREILEAINDSFYNTVTDSEDVGLYVYNDGGRIYKEGEVTVQDNAIWQNISGSTSGSFDPTYWNKIAPFSAMTDNFILKTNAVELDDNKKIVQLADDASINNLETSFYQINAVNTSIGLDQEYPVAGHSFLQSFSGTSASRSVQYLTPFAEPTKLYIRTLNGDWNEIDLSSLTYIFGEGLDTFGNEVVLGGEYSNVTLSPEDNSSNFNIEGGVVNIASNNNSFNVNPANVQLSSPNGVFVNNLTPTSIAEYESDVFGGADTADANAIPSFSLLQNYVNSVAANFAFDAEFVNGLTASTSNSATTIGLGGTLETNVELDLSGQTLSFLPDNPNFGAISEFGDGNTKLSHINALANRRFNLKLDSNSVAMQVRNSADTQTTNSVSVSSAGVQFLGNINHNGTGNASFNNNGYFRLQNSDVRFTSLPTVSDLNNYDLLAINKSNGGIRETSITSLLSSVSGANKFETLSATTLSAETIYSAGTDLYDIFGTSSVNSPYSGNANTGSILPISGDNISTGLYSVVVGGKNNTASGDHSFIEGLGNQADGDRSHAEGNSTRAQGFASHSEGSYGISVGTHSHSEGQNTYAFGNRSHTEGYETSGIGDSSHAEGKQTLASGNRSHASGQYTIASGAYSYAGGYRTSATNTSSHAEGFDTLASGQISHAEGRGAIALGNFSHAQGRETLASGSYCHAEGYQSSAMTNNSHAEGFGTLALGVYSHTEGFQTRALEAYSHAQGFQTSATGSASSAQGFRTLASGNNSNAEGINTLASGANSHAEGSYSNSLGVMSHAQNFDTLASGVYSHAGGQRSVASGKTSFVHSSGSTTNADDSAILGGVSNKLESTATRAVILGGQNITGSTADTVYGVNFDAQGVIYSGGTDLYDIFGTGSGTGDITRVQNGLNTYTGGTENEPNVNVSGITVDNITSTGTSRFDTVEVDDAGNWRTALSSPSAGIINVGDDPSITEVGISSKRFTEAKGASSTQEYVLTSLDGYVSADVQADEGYINATVADSNGITLDDERAFSANTGQQASRDGSQGAYSYYEDEYNYYKYTAIEDNVWWRENISSFEFKGQTTNGTETELFLNRVSGQRFNIIDNTGVGFELHIKAFDLFGGDFQYSKITGAIKRDAGTVSLVGVNNEQTNSDAALTLNIDVEADDVNKALVVNVTGEAGKTIDWYGKLKVV